MQNNIQTFVYFIPVPVNAMNAGALMNTHVIPQAYGPIAIDLNLAVTFTYAQIIKDLEQSVLSSAMVGIRHYIYRKVLHSLRHEEWQRFCEENNQVPVVHYRWRQFENQWFRETWQRIRFRIHEREEVFGNGERMKFEKVYAVPSRRGGCEFYKIRA